MTTELLLRDANLWGTGPADVLIRSGRIAEIGHGLQSCEVEELGGKLVIPGLVDGHAHIDKTMWGGPWASHASAPGLMGKIRGGQERRPEFGIPSADYIAALLENMITLGTTHVRTHVDVDTVMGLDAVDAVREAFARHEGRVTGQLVAFPQAGLLIAPGTDKLLEEALRQGVDLIGGLDPAGLENDAVKHLDIVFGLAERYGVGVDIHLHDRGSLGEWQYRLIIERTRALGLRGKVTVSHGFALSDAAPAVRAELLEGLAEAGIAIASIAPPGRAMPLKELAAAGVAMTLGNDGVRDLWSPYGTGCMLDRALLQAQQTGPLDEDIELALHAATYGGARVTGLADYGLAVGDVADLVVVDARNAAEAVCVRPVRSLVLKAGRVVAREGFLV
ncbi:amidohydrolase [Nonomuraea dietziae]|uniref:Cytosine deaminase n=1 Tax=Nonomuraea dietziae TaxID=65515 RepID=A0A7W5V702_9ACTN|nr:amidohydrolase [Nonomuraea dietziae]MBB3727153.1 cytosine deaminase [Nonomuraea dietziae]